MQEATVIMRKPRQSVASFAAMRRAAE